MCVWDTVSLQYLYKILDLCEEQGIKVVMTYLPVAISHEQDWMALNTAKKISEEREVLEEKLKYFKDSTVPKFMTIGIQKELPEELITWLLSFDNKFLSKNTEKSGILGGLEVYSSPILKERSRETKP